jgi:hypothetical protein
VPADNSDPGLLHVDPVGVDADHIGICKPAHRSDVVYARTRDFIAEILAGALPFPSELLNATTVEQIAAAIRAKAPGLTTEQIDQFIHSLRELRGDPSFGQAVEAAKKRNTRIAQGIWLQIYKNKDKEILLAQAEKAEAAHNLAASIVVSDVRRGLEWYREATFLALTTWQAGSDVAMPRWKLTFWGTPDIKSMSRLRQLVTQCSHVKELRGAQKIERGRGGANGRHHVSEGERLAPIGILGHWPSLRGRRSRFVKTLSLKSLLDRDLDRRIITVPPVEPERVLRIRMQRRLAHEPRCGPLMPLRGVDEEGMAHVDVACLAGRRRLRPVGAHLVQHHIFTFICRLNSHG